MLQDRGRNDVDSQAQERIMERQHGCAMEQLEVIKAEERTSGDVHPNCS